MSLDVASCGVGGLSGLTIRSLMLRGSQARLLCDCSKARRVLLAMRRFTSVQFSGKGRVLVALDMGVRILCLTKTLCSSVSETGSCVTRSRRRETAASLASAVVEISEMYSRKAFSIGYTSWFASTDSA